VSPVSDEFHARFKAVARRYRYVIYNHPFRSSLLAGMVTWHYHALDLTRMQAAARYLVGSMTLRRSVQWLVRRRTHVAMCISSNSPSVAR
jgi:tRNA pseudouridine(38-40) synthase